MAPQDASGSVGALQAEVERLRDALSDATRRAEALEAAHAHAQGVLQVAVDGIITIDASGRIEFVNPAVCEIFGFSEDELVGQDVKILMPEPVGGRHQAHVDTYRRTREPRILGRAREVLARHRDGSVFPAELAVSEAMADSRLLFTGTIRDLSEQRRAEARIQQDRDRLRAIFESAVDGIVSIDEKGTVLEANPAIETLFGYAPDEVIGRNVKLLMPPPFRDEHDDYLRRYLETGEPRIIGTGREVRGRCKDGTTFPLYLAVSEGYEGERRLFTAFLHDLGRLREVEGRARRAEQLAEISTISAGIAHDVGTPMTTILGYAELLQKSVKNPRNRERAGHIVDQVMRVKDLLRTLLDLSRPRSVDPAEIDLVEVLDHSLGFFRERLKGRGIVVERKFASVPRIVAKRDRLEQVFLNLVVNAIDAMPSGGPLSVELGQPSPELVEVTIADTGIGIPPEALEHVFEPFYTTKERGKGTGLGLLVSRRIIDDHGGTLSAESEVDVGTRMRIRLPVGVAARVPSGGDSSGGVPSGKGASDATGALPKGG